jgi:hypothetical protein
MSNFMQNKNICRTVRARFNTTTVFTVNLHCKKAMSESDLDERGTENVVGVRI